MTTKKKKAGAKAVKPVGRRKMRGGKSPVSREKRVKWRVLIADPCPLVGRGMRSVIEEQSDIVFCGAADSVSAARAAMAKERPDLLIVNVWLGADDGLEFIKALHAESPALPVLACSQHDEALYAERALRAGAIGYVQNNCPIEVLLEAIRTALAGEVYVSRKMAAVIMHNYVQGRNSGEASIVDILSDRELQCFLRLGAGLGSRQVAEGLKISLKTVESYRENIKRKLGLHDAAELTHCAMLFVDAQSRGGSGIVITKNASDMPRGSLRK